MAVVSAETYIRDAAHGSFLEGAVVELLHGTLKVRGSLVLNEAEVMSAVKFADSGYRRHTPCRCHWHRGRE